MAFALTALGAALACSLEMLEAMAIVRAVALERRPRDAVLGGLAGARAALALGAILGPVLIARVAEESLRLVVGVALCLFGLEWLREGILRLAGQRSRSSVFDEFLEEREELATNKWRRAPLIGHDHQRCPRTPPAASLPGTLAPL